MNSDSDVSELSQQKTEGEDPAFTKADSSKGAAANPSQQNMPMKLKKAPDAPKRFKSAFIFFSTEKHKEIRAKMEAEGNSEKTVTIAKLVSEAWRNLTPEEREKWDVMARRDKARYEVEKTMYKGPWKVPAVKRSLKDPAAPKRPMSAFLAFSNSRRAMVKRQHSHMGNAEISKHLSTMWKEAPEEVRQKYIDQEFTKRQAYKATMADWRKKTSEEKRIERQIREDFALRKVEAAEQSVYDGSEETDMQSAARRASFVGSDSAAFDRFGRMSSVAGMPPYETAARDPFLLPGGSRPSQFAHASLTTPSRGQAGLEEKMTHSFDPVGGGPNQPLTSLLSYGNPPYSLAAATLRDRYESEMMGPNPFYGSDSTSSHGYSYFPGFPGSAAAAASFHHQGLPPHGSLFAHSPSSSHPSTMFQGGSAPYFIPNPFASPYPHDGSRGIPGYPPTGVGTTPAGHLASQYASHFPDYYPSAGFTPYYGQINAAAAAGTGALNPHYATRNYGDENDDDDDEVDGAAADLTRRLQRRRESLRRQNHPFGDQHDTQPPDWDQPG